MDMQVASFAHSLPAEILAICVEHPLKQRDIQRSSIARGGELQFDDHIVGLLIWPSGESI
jgi:hypothetical protein